MQTIWKTNNGNKRIHGQLGSKDGAMVLLLGGSSKSFAQAKTFFNSYLIGFMSKTTSPEIKMTESKI